MNYNVFTKKEAKQFINKLEQQHGIKKIELDYIFLRSKDRIYIVSKQFSKADLSNLNISSIGLYFANTEDKIRLTIEGSQIIGNLAEKNVLELNEEQVKNYFKGEDIKTNEDFNSFVLLKYNNLFLGSGKFKEGKIINSFPKERRIKFK